MTILLWLAAAWLATATLIVMAFAGARRSDRVYAWLFGAKPTAEVHRLVQPQPAPAAEHGSRLAA